MKKGYLLFILGLMFVPVITSATSGACSSHGGVNCSYGPTLEGKVMCNDGWTNSSVYFSEADECKISSCTLPSGSGCKTENDYGVLSIKLISSGGYLGGSASNQGALNQCRNEIEAYQSAYQAYQQCLSASQSNINSYIPQNFYSGTYVYDEMNKYCVGLYGPDSNYSNNKCECNQGYITDGTNNFKCTLEKEVYNNSCKKSYGLYSISTPNELGQCSCFEGYVFGDSKQCIPQDNYCVQENGAGSWYNLEKFVCEWCESNGIRGVKKDGQCVFPNITSPATVIPATVKNIPTVVTPPVVIPAKKLINVKINIEPKKQESTLNTDSIGLATTSLTTSSETSSISATQVKKEPKKSIFSIISQKILGLLKFIGF